MQDSAGDPVVTTMTLGPAFMGHASWWGRQTVDKQTCILLEIVTQAIKRIMRDNLFTNTGTCLITQQYNR